MTQKKKEGKCENVIRRILAHRWEPTHITKCTSRSVPLQYPSYLKHSTTIVSCLLIVFPSTPHCITLVFNTSNLFWGIMIPFSPSFPFLQLQARCLNFSQHLHNFPLLPSSSSLSLVREHFSLSRLLINEWYWSKDIVLCLLNRVRNEWLILLKTISTGAQDLYPAGHLLPYRLLP